MNWDAIGAIGEIVGAIAVVATLVYLATQIRVASVAAESQGSYSSAEVYSRYRHAVINNPGIVAAIAKANAGNHLTAQEDLQLATVLDELLVAALVSTTSTERWVTMQPSATDFIYLKLIFSENPGLMRYWYKRKDFCATVSTRFVETMDQMLSTIEAEGVPPNKSTESDT